MLHHGTDIFIGHFSEPLPHLPCPSTRSLSTVLVQQSGSVYGISQLVHRRNETRPTAVVEWGGEDHSVIRLLLGKCLHPDKQLCAYLGWKNDWEGSILRFCHWGVAHVMMTGHTGTAWEEPDYLFSFFSILFRFGFFFFFFLTFLKKYLFGCTGS